MPNRVKELRQAAGKSKEQLAVESGYTYHGIEALEAHPERTTNARYLPALADALGVTMTDVHGVKPMTPERARKVVTVMGLGGGAA